MIFYRVDYWTEEDGPRSKYLPSKKLAEKWAKGILPESTNDVSLYRLELPNTRKASILGALNAAESGNTAGSFSCWPGSEVHLKEYRKELSISCPECGSQSHRVQDGYHSCLNCGADW